MADDDRLWLWSEVDCLGQAHAITLIGPAGDTMYVLVDPGHHCDGCPLPAAPWHEQTGPLPEIERERIANMRVARPGQCRWTRVPDEGGIFWRRCRNNARPGRRYCHTHERVAAREAP